MSYTTFGQGFNPCPFLFSHSQDLTTQKCNHYHKPGTMPGFLFFHSVNAGRKQGNPAPLRGHPCFRPALGLLDDTRCPVQAVDGRQDGKHKACHDGRQDAKHKACHV